MMPDGLYVQYGCGHCAPDGWLNFDASRTLRAERVLMLGWFVRKNARRFPASVRYGDITKRLPVPDVSCAGVYASHVLEHLALDDFHRALDETFRILRPGGVFRAVVPDLEALAAAYLDELRNGLAHEAAGRFMRGSHLGRERRVRGLKGLLTAWLGNSDHLWMWDHPSLAAALAEHGFIGTRRARFGDAADPAFRAVEDPGRFERAVAVEAAKPIEPVTRHATPAQRRAAPRRSSNGLSLRLVAHPRLRGNRAGASVRAGAGLVSGQPHSENVSLLAPAAVF